MSQTARKSRAGARLIPPLVVVALRLWRGVGAGQWKRALPITILAMLFRDVGMGHFRH